MYFIWGKGGIYEITDSVSSNKNEGVQDNNTISIVLFSGIIFQMMEQEEDVSSDQEKIPSPSLSQRPQSPNKLSPRASAIRLKLPDYQRFTKIYPTHLRDFTKYDSLLNDSDKEIEVSPLFAWLILLLNMLSTAMVPCWLMQNLKYQSMTQNSWRFLTVSILTLPFVAYEKRQISAVGGNIFSLINSEMIKKNFMSSISICIWFLIVKYAVKLTSMIHTFNLMSLQSLFIVVKKIVWKKGYHQFQSAGTILIVAGLLLMVYDSMTGEVEDGRTNERYISYSNLSRVMGDLLSILGSAISVYFSERYETPSQPRFLNVFIFNFFIGFNFIWFGYFFGGSDLSFDEFYGVFGVLSKQNLPSIFYIGIMLGFNLMIGNILINQIFSKVIIRISNCFIILIMGVFMHLLDIELANSGLTSLSFGLVVPGLILIMSGQHLLENNEIKMDFVIYKPTHEQNTFFQGDIEMEEIIEGKNNQERLTKNQVKCHDRRSL